MLTQMYESTWIHQVVSFNDNIGMAKLLMTNTYLDVIGTSYCRSRAIACTKDEYEQI